MKSEAIVELHLLRHADAGDPMTFRGDDSDRPLSSKGERQAARLGRLLVATGFAPDAIITSPKVRARQTAEAIGTVLGVDVAIDARLGDTLDTTTVDRILADASLPGRPVLVGHDPDLSWLASELTGARIEMRKGALVRIDIERLDGGAGILRWLLPPGLVPEDAVGRSAG